MVEISCPECSDIIDLGEAKEGAYLCPYCDVEFRMVSDDESHPSSAIIPLVRGGLGRGVAFMTFPLVIALTSGEFTGNIELDWYPCLCFGVFAIPFLAIGGKMVQEAIDTTR